MYAGGYLRTYVETGTHVVRSSENCEWACTIKECPNRVIGADMARSYQHLPDQCRPSLELVIVNQSLSEALLI